MKYLLLLLSLLSFNAQSASVTILDSTSDAATSDVFKVLPNQTATLLFYQSVFDTYADLQFTPDDGTVWVTWLSSSIQKDGSRVKRL